MKKAIMIFNACLLVAFLAACGNQNDSTNEPSESNPPVNNQTENDPPQEENQDDLTEEDAADEGNTTDNDGSIEAKNQEDMKKMMTDLNFQEIEIEISYGPDNEYEAKIEHHDNGDVEAEVEDELNNVKIEDDLEAFNHIYPKVKQLNITQDAANEEVIQEVLSAFDLEDNYEDFKVEIEFNDGTEVSFKD